MNQTILFDGKRSREVLKAIRYGMEVRLDTSLQDDDAEHLRGRLVDLKKAYLAKRRFIDEKRSDFGNFIFYQLLLEKYPEFEYRFDKHGRLRSNLYEFKVDGHLPSLLTMLLNERIGRLTELEKRYGRSAKFGALFAPVEQLFQDATLVYPDSATFFRFLEALTLAAQGDEPLTVVSAICPDYSYIAEADAVRYTFESLGSQPGLAGNKFIAVLPAITRCLDALGVPHEVALFGGDFESLAFIDSSSSLQISQHDFIARVRQQIVAISDAVEQPVSQSFFFDVVGGQANWIARHEEIYQSLASGDYGQTDLSEADIDAIYASRMPLYAAWFDNADDDKLWHIFLRQAAEYALMGEVYAKLYRNVVVLGVDHSRMAPFYSFAQKLAVIYRKTDYIVDTAAQDASSENSPASQLDATPSRPPQAIRTADDAAIRHAEDAREEESVR